MTPDRLPEIAAQSDSDLYVMAVLQFIGLTAIIDRFWFLGRTISRRKPVTSAAAQFAHLDRKTLPDLEKSTRLPYRALLELPLYHSELKDAHRPTNELVSALAMSAKSSRYHHSISSIWPWPSPRRLRSPCLIWPQ
ncbi:hypothetical protein [Bradyrhizobium iriomotense]|uniref:hypothetical protein n=1 Tax=Bradyrhizobium iriomotense TaxID=441950 RepID=UPI0024E11012|nr:hypothetical protein [Bradyrhizobium iriomotense]